MPEIPYYGPPIDPGPRTYGQILDDLRRVQDKVRSLKSQRDELLSALEDIARSAQARQLAPGLREIAEEAIEDNRQRRAG